MLQMLVPGDLGFPALVLVFFFIFLSFPILSFLVQWRCNIVAERKEEILRLVELASEESARAELDEFGVFGSSRGAFQCAVCSCPTTTRCSRCKSVRYCSGKCQIIHWRKGHKEKCHPLNTSMWLNGVESNFDQQVLLQEEQHKFHKDLEIKGKRCAKSIETFAEEYAPSDSTISCHLFAEKDDKFGTLLDASHGSPTDFYVGDIAVPDTLNRSKRSLNYNVPPYVVETSSDVYDTNLPPSEFTGPVSYVHSVSLRNKLKPNTRSRSSVVSQCGSATSLGSSINDLEQCTVSEPFIYSSEATFDTSIYGNEIRANYAECNSTANGILSDSGSLQGFPTDWSRHTSTSPLLHFKPQILGCDDANPTSFGERKTTSGVSPFDKVVPNAFTVNSVMRSGCPAAVDDYHNNGSQPLESKGRKSLSSITSVHHSRSSGRPTSVPSLKSLNSSEIASSVPNPSNGLKTSVRKVAQLFGVRTLSNHHSSEFDCEVVGKNKFKMLFPYELFIKLYNWEKMELRPCGFTNCGNTCYANAVLQCLAFTQPLTAYLLQGIHSKACPKKEWCFTCEFECLILKSSKGGSPLSPIGIVSRIQSIGSHLSHGKEEDAHEFLRCAIDNMQSVCLKEAGVDALSPLAEETTLIGLIFGGYLRSKIKCMKCCGKSEQHERMMDLTIEIQGDIVTLEEALGRFTATEILDGENKYECGRCKSYEKAKKKMTVLEAPNVLTIAFKRFQSGKFGKLNKSVQFSETLNLAPYMSGKSDKSLLYRLYAVVVHLDVMNAAFSGHYVCYVKNTQGNWFKVDDGRVKPVELERVLSKGAYMLLYARCSPQAPTFMRSAMISGIKTKQDKSSEAIATCHSGKDTTSSARPSPRVLRDDPFALRRRPEDCSHLKPFDAFSSFESFDSVNRRFHQVNRIPRVNSMSDSSSLFSCSDEGSCSTESTRDSISTDDFSDYIFGDSRCRWNSPRRVSEDSDVSSSRLRHSPTAVSDRNMLHTYETRYPPCGVEVVEENPPFLYTDKAKYGRKLRQPTSSISSRSSSETDSEQLGRGSPYDMRPDVSLRRSTWENTAQPFY